MKSKIIEDAIKGLTSSPIPTEDEVQETQRVISKRSMEDLARLRKRNRAIIRLSTDDAMGNG